MALANRLAATGMGALGGAGAGTAFGPWGTAAGGVLGGLSGLLGSADAQAAAPQPRQQGLGNQFGLQQAPRFSPQAQSGIEQLIGRGMGQNFDFAPIAQQARRQFQQQTIPSIAERFTAMGGEGAQRSSAFRNAMESAGTGLETNLAALQSQHGLQQQQLLQNLLTQPTFDTFRPPREPGTLESLGAPLVQGLGQGFSQAIPAMVRLWQQRSAKNGGQLNDNDLQQIIQQIRTMFGGK